MRGRTISVLAVLTVVSSLAPSTSRLSAQAAPASKARWTAVETALGRPGALQPGPGNVIKFGFPRGDLTVVANGVTVKPAFALGSWVAFEEMGRGQAMVMGDLVLIESEVAPVIRALQEGGIELTALHNHLLMESPRVMYVHISARGDAAKIAAAIHSALQQTATPQTAPTPATADASGLDTAAIARELGHSGKLNGSVYQVTVPRSERITDGGHEVPPSMGVATGINFQPSGDGKVAVTGDFVLRASEVNPVIRALEANGIEPTAVHSHMLDENPRLFFMHFWGNDDAVTLAKGLRAALDRTSSKKSSK